MDPRVKKPANLRSPWPPTDFQQKVQVSAPWDDWWTLANIFRKDDPDPWDIIFYNFETYDPEEVNWYLREWLGCRRKSPSQKNYQFGREPGNTAPIELYIPKPDFLPPGPLQKEARQAILTVLREPAVWTMQFKLGSFELQFADLMIIEQLIETEKIRIVHRPTLGHMAQYRSTINTLLSPFGTLPPVENRGLIVHECVHAVMDMRKTPATKELSEGAAYVAQALYLLANGKDMANWTPSPPFMVNPGNFIAWKGIFTRASSIASDIVNGRPVSDLDLMLFAGAIDMTKTYWMQGTPVNDGI